MSSIRDYINLLENLSNHEKLEKASLNEGFRYAGNCTDGTTAPYLQDMMDDAKRITYRTFVNAVGLDSMREIFGDYAWGYQRGEIRMKNDPYVYYYRSRYNGKPCYYVRHSGIEYIFVSDDEDEENDDHPKMPITPNRFSVMGDGALLQGIEGRATFHGTKTPSSLTISCSIAPSAHAARTLLRMIKQSKLETVTVDDEEETAKEMMAWLRTFI